LSETDNINLDYRFKLIIIFILIIPLFFGFNKEFIFPSNFSLVDFIIIIFGIIFLFIFGIFFITPFFKTQHFEKMKKHEVVKAFINREYKPLYRSFLLSMIIDEMIFRFYIAGVLIQYLEMINVIILSSTIFSVYHVYIWFYLKDIRVLCVYL
jgi:membrane protease YdiL (CAAX protease family)